jgi:hypothetical protein
VCDSCGHQVVDRPGFRCSCIKCAEQFSFAQPSGPARTDSRMTAPSETNLRQFGS